jgi:hypothetical protein
MLDSQIENVRVYVNDTLVDSVDKITNASSTTLRDEAINFATDYYNFDSSFELNDDDLIKVYVDLTKDAQATTQFKFLIDNAGLVATAGSSNSLRDVEYVADGETVSTLAANNKLTGTAISNLAEVVASSAGASMTRNDGFVNEVYLAGQTDAVLMRFVVNAGNSSSLDIKKLNFDAVSIAG